MLAAADVISMNTSMVLTSLGQTEHKVASDIVWTMNFGVGTDQNDALPTTRWLEPRMHQFWAGIECHAETMQYVRMKGDTDKPTTQIVNIDTNKL
jgi:hypothetical protein